MLDVLSLDRISAKTRHDPIPYRELEKKIYGESAPGRRDPYKEIRQKLTIEHCMICNGDSPETQRKLVLKNVHDDIHGGVAVTHIKKDEIRSIVASLLRRCRRIYKKLQKMWRNKKFYTEYFTFVAHRSGAMDSNAYWSCMHYWSGTLINTCKLFFRLAWSIPCARQEKIYNKRDS